MSEDTITLTFSREELGKVRLGLEEVERGYIASIKVCIPGGPTQQRFQAELEIIQSGLRKVNDALGTWQNLLDAD